MNEDKLSELYICSLCLIQKRPKACVSTLAWTYPQLGKLGTGVAVILLLVIGLYIASQELIEKEHIYDGVM